MPQPILPLFSSDMIEINNRIAVIKKDDTVFWFQGSIPVFCHHTRNEEQFRSFCCQLINLGNATSAEIARGLNVNHEKLSRWARSARASSNLEVSLKPRKSTSTKKKDMS